MLTVIQLVKKYPSLSQALAITTPPAVGWELEFTPQAGGFPEPSEDGAAGGRFGRGRVSWAEGLEGSRGTRDGGPLQRRESSEETLEHRSPSWGVQDSGEGYGPRCWKSDVFPRWETDLHRGLAHTMPSKVALWLSLCLGRALCADSRT